MDQFPQMYSLHRSRVKDHDTSLPIRNEYFGQEEWKTCGGFAQQRAREILSTIVVTIALRVRRFRGFVHSRGVKIGV